MRFVHGTKNMGTMDRRNRTQASKNSRESMFQIVEANVNCQSDIKKLRRENEQLRREIWGLRDEYDKLEEILKQQNLKKNSDNSDTNTDYSEDEDDEDNETDKDVKKEKRLDNKECQKSDDMHRLKVDFDELSVVDEEEELAKLKDPKNGVKNQTCDPNCSHLFEKDMIQETLPFYSISYEPPSNDLYSSYPPVFPPECPFIFPAPSRNYSDKSLEETLLIPPCPTMYSNDVSPTDNADIPRPTSTLDSHLGSTGFPSVSDLDNSSSEASVQTRSTKVASSSNIPKLSSISGDNACSIPKSVQENSGKTELESSKKPKHFFAPLSNKFNLQKSEPDETVPIIDNTCNKGSVDICINEVFSDNQPSTFLSSENLFVNNDIEKRSSGINLTKSLSFHDIPKSDCSSINSKSKHVKSENALDSTGSFRTRLDITLKPSFKPSTPTTPEVPKLPSFDNKLFTNQYHQHFEQYRNYMSQAMKKPLRVQVPESPNFCPGFYGFIPIPAKDSTKEKNTDSLERYQTLILNGKMKSPKNIQVTSFETPSPRTLQIPPMTPYDLNLLYSKISGLTPDVHNSDLYHNLPLLTKDGTVICPNGPGLKVQCEACLKKIPAQTQTSTEEDSVETNRKKLKKQKSSSENISATVTTQRRKERLKKQASMTSTDVPESVISVATKRKEALEEKNESRSSSSGGESPRKDHKRMSNYFNSKKRPSISSARTSNSLSLDVNAKSFTGSDIVDSAGTGSDKEKPNSNRVSDETERRKARKSSTSSESVPWCACWGNGCI